MKKKISIILVVTILILISAVMIYSQIEKTIGTTNIPSSAALKETQTPYIEVIKDMSSFGKDKTITLTFKYRNLTEKISYAEAYIEYDKNIFQQVTKNDFSIEFDEDIIDRFSYNDDIGKIVVQFIEDTQVDTLCTLKLKVLDTVTKATETSFNLSYGYTYTFRPAPGIEIEYEDVTTELEIPIESRDPNGPLYLSTDVYKIGDNDIKNYEEGDKYISRVQKETTMEQFIANLKTNGTITILKKDGTALGKDELVGTGMTLRVTKDEETIEVKIVVMGDIDGNGLITATDLSAENQLLVEMIELKDEYWLAADIDESGKITATDLSAENQMLVGMI